MNNIIDKKQLLREISSREMRIRDSEDFISRLEGELEEAKEELKRDLDKLELCQDILKEWE
jgi:hypothetical protein